MSCFRSRSSSPVVKCDPKTDLAKSEDKQLDPGEIVVLDSDDEESRNARARMEARMRAQIEHRRLEEFESIIRGKNKKTPEPKKRRKRPVKDPTPIVLSDWRSWVRIPTWALPFFFYPKKSYTEISVLVQREKTHTCQFVWPHFDFRKFHFSKL